MKIFTISLITILLALCTRQEQLFAQKYVDNDYWMVVPANYSSDYNIFPFLTFTAEKPTNITVKAAAATYTVYTDQTGSVMPNPMPLVPQHKQVVRKAIHAYSTDSLPFHVQIMMGPEEWGEGTWCLPTHALGMNYRIACYKKSIEFNHPINTRGTPEFAIVAPYDSTHVTIHFSPGSNLVDISIALNSAQVYHIDCGKPDVNIDPTGTRITSDRPIGVFSGHANAIIPDGGAYGNSLIEQMLPVESWGKLHMIVADPRLPSDIFRFIPDCDNTKIYNDGALIATVNAGKYCETSLSGAHEIYSDKPIMIAKYTKSANTLYGSEEGGSSMLIIPPTDRYFDSTRFYQVHLPFELIDNGVPGVVVIAPTAYIASVQFDGSPVVGFVPITNTYSPVQYSYAYVPMLASATGAHQLCYTTPPAGNPYSLYGYYTCQDGDRDETLTLNLGYRPAHLPLAMIPQNADMGTLLCDTTETMKTIVKNLGAGPLIISSASGLSAPFTLSSPSFPDTIVPGDSVALSITFTSSTPGTYAKKLILATNDSGSCGLPFHTIDITARKDVAAITSKPSRMDFGIVQCKDIDTVVTITNVGTVNVSVKDTSFTGSGITAVSPPLPITIQPGHSIDLHLHFSPAQIPYGVYNCLLNTVTLPCDLHSQFSFTANRQMLSYAVTPPLNDFGITAVNKTSTGHVTFTNQSKVDVRLSGAVFSPSSPMWNVTTSFPQTVPSGGSLDIYFTATPPDTQKYNADLVVSIDSACPDTCKSSVAVEGVSTCLKATPMTVIGKTPGDVATIPIFIDPSSKFTSTTSIDLTVSYNEELLRFSSTPTSPIGHVSNVTHSDGRVSFTIDNITTITTPNSHVADVYVEALLAPYATGTIDVASSLFTLSSGEKIEGGYCPASFSLGHDCVLQDQLRHRSSVSIEAIYPNPSHSTTIIVVNADGSPIVKIDVFDAFGRRVEMLHDGVLTSGKHELSIASERYANGIYFCRIIQEGKVISREFNVQR